VRDLRAAASTPFIILPLRKRSVYGTNGEERRSQGLALRGNCTGERGSFVISTQLGRYAIFSGVKAGTKREARKSPRAKLGGAVRVTVRKPGNQRIEARLHEISVTGGLLFLEEPIDEGSQLMLIFETPSGLVKETAEMLLPHWSTKGCLQPFRFTDPGERSQRRLQRTLQHLLGSKS